MHTLDKSIVLVGHMAAGKTSLGQAVAGALSVGFADSDVLIESTAKRSIAEIFAEFGEAEFRAREYALLQRLLGGQPMIIASGGGMFIQPKCRALIGQHAISLWLRASLECLADRLVADKARLGEDARPLLAGKDIGAVLQQLAKARDAIYGTADLVVDTDCPQQEAVLRITAAISDYGAGAVTMGARAYS